MLLFSALVCDNSLFVYAVPLCFLISFNNVTLNLPVCSDHPETAGAGGGEAEAAGREGRSCGESVARRSR